MRRCGGQRGTRERGGRRGSAPAQAFVGARRDELWSFVQQGVKQPDALRGGTFPASRVCVRGKDFLTFLLSRKRGLLGEGGGYLLDEAKFWPERGYPPHKMSQHRLLRRGRPSPPPRAKMG